MPDEQKTDSRVVKKPSLGLPIAIVIAGIVVGGAIFMSGRSTNQAPGMNVQRSIDTAQQPETIVAPVTEADHIRGNPNAPILIVEYSDFDCPFCKNFHETMNRIMDKYGKDGKVAWVYRQFPLKELHPNAPKLAEASECVAEFGGNDAFWKFADSVFGNRDINAQTDMTQLPAYAESAGVDKDKFTSCFESGKYTPQIASDVEAAVKTGARGTPYSIVMVGKEQGVINGAQPYEVVDQMMSNLTAQLEGRATSTSE